MKTVDINRNNLEQSVSPYLRQHAENPVHWQEWSKEVLQYAKINNRKILISIGYSTCHWCHVMASEAFSDNEVAQYLNDNFVSIKIDREERPDIDMHFMQFMNATTGRGGWPLNVILSPDAEPIIPFTYLPVESKRGLPSFIQFIKAVNEKGEALEYEIIESNLKSSRSGIDKTAELLVQWHDNEYGGFGEGPKFPPCCSLLFLMSYYERYGLKEIMNPIKHTLDAMMTGGMHDHLQGGFFRYCVDRRWTIPHFEKMLYDQAMLLWVYSWGLMLLKNSSYEEVINGILKCLEETFNENGFYIAAHDADTHHIEGETYLWSSEELGQILDPAEYAYLEKEYYITAEGNFEGRNHLVRRRDAAFTAVESKLLEIRKRRTQPFADRKIITSWNAYTGIALVMAWRATGNSVLLSRAEDLLIKLSAEHSVNDKIIHSSLEGKKQDHGFLEDAAALLLFATYLHEEKRDRAHLLMKLRDELLKYHDSGWFENSGNDFIRVKGGGFDHPLPSSTAAAELSLLRTSILLNEEYSSPETGSGTGREFSALAGFIAQGEWHIIHSPELLPWQDLPLNTIQVYGENHLHCFSGSCDLTYKPL